MKLPLAAVILAATSLSTSAQTFQSSAGELKVETVVSGLANPWAIAFLPDGRMLVTEKPGRLRIATRDGKLSQPVAGVPPVFAVSQGGLHDVILDRSFTQNGTIYICYAEPVSGGGRTALLRAKLVDEAAPKLDDVKVIYRQEGPLSTGGHFGCRILQTPDNNLFLTQGDHFRHRDEAQNLENHLGKLIRIAPDGSVPQDNPFVGRSGAKPEIWSYGHRNMQGAALHPVTGKLWEHEHGPRGGDEINIPQAGGNYGWPLATHGINYTLLPIPEARGKAVDGTEAPHHVWEKSPAISGMAFYDAQRFPAWQHNLFIGALATQELIRLQLDGDRVVHEERLLGDLGVRIRDVRQGPDGYLYLLTDQKDGQLLRLGLAR